MTTTVVQVSGGVSSAAALVVVVSMAKGVTVGHFVDHGQPNVEAERSAARAICAHVGVELVESRCDLSRDADGCVPGLRAALGMASANLAAVLGAITVAVGDREGKRMAAFYGAMNVAVMGGSDIGRSVGFWQPVRGWSRQMAASRVALAGFDAATLCSVDV